MASRCGRQQPTAIGPVEVPCEMLEVSRRSYYTWLGVWLVARRNFSQRPRSPRRGKRVELVRINPSGAVDLGLVALGGCHSRSEHRHRPCVVSTYWTVFVSMKCVTTPSTPT